MAATSVEAITADARAAVQGIIADARVAADTITAEAQRSALSAIASVQKSITGAVADVRKSVAGAVADMRVSVTEAVSDTAHQIGADFAAHVNSEITTMTANFKASHPDVTQATTEVVGYVDAVGTAATVVQQMSTKVTDAATQLKEMPSAVRDIRTAIKETLIEVGQLGRDLHQLGTGGTPSLRNLGTTLTGKMQRGFSVVRKQAIDAAEGIGRFTKASRDVAKTIGDGIRNLVQLARGYAKAGIQAALAAVRTVAMAIAQRVVTVATRIWAAVQTLLNIAMSLNPIGLIIAGIMILVGLFVLAYKRSDTFRSIVQGAMRGVQIAIGWVMKAARSVFDWIRNHWKLLLVILTAPIGLAVLLITSNWDRIKTGVALVRDWIVKIWNGLVNFFTGLPDRLAGAATRMWDAFRNAARVAINFVIDAWNALDFGIHIGLPSVMGYGGFRFDVDDVIPDIPRLAEGGLVRSRPGGVLALLGEGREDELVIPLSRVPTLGGVTGRPITVNVYPRPGQSEYEIGRIVARELAWAAKH